MSASGEPTAPTPDMKESEERAIAFAHDCTKPLDRLFAFLKRNDLPDNVASSVLYQVHEDLRLIRKWTNLRVVQGSARPYLAGSAAAAFDSVFPRRKDDDVDSTQVVMPISVQETLSPRKLREISVMCIHPETGRKPRCVTIAVVDDDSTTAYYRIFDSFAEIVHPQWKQKKKRPKNEEAMNGTEEKNIHAKMKRNSESESDGSESD